jgi:glycosyltransferase involved in cell wall biosynthesis
MLHLHPDMRPRLARLGVRENEMTYVSYGLDVTGTASVPRQERIYDAVWIGRVHRQKGIDDLLATLAHLAARVTDFRAVLVGNVQESLRPRIRELGLERCVAFSGFVSEQEKIRLFKASRVFLMPSKHEGSPRVIGESVIAETPVVAYDIPNYRPVFGDFVRYVPPFDLAAFQGAAEAAVRAMRRGENDLEQLDLDRFKRENSWETTRTRFLNALTGLR